MATEKAGGWETPLRPKGYQVKRPTRRENSAIIIEDLRGLEEHSAVS